MNAILASWIGGSIKSGNGRLPAPILTYNHLSDNLKSIWPTEAKILLICSSPNDYEKTDGIYNCFKESFPLSGFKYSTFDKCDDRNANIIERLSEMNVIILIGGHVPTQNAFFKQIHLKERLQAYQGIIIAWSAGSMNCAETVYASPEFEGEALDPTYQRWISGLGITKVNIFPHYDRLKDEMLDGLRIMEDITYPDSMVHEFIAINDGSYLMIRDGIETLYGESYRIKGGNIQQLCSNGESYVLTR